MNLRAVQATAGTLVCDSLPYSQSGTTQIAKALAAENVKAMFGYVGAINAARVGYLIDAGIQVGLVTFGQTVDHFDGAKVVAAAKALGYPLGAHIMLDVEGLAIFHTLAATLMAAADLWGKIVRDAGYLDGVYIGVPQPLDSAQLYALHESLYWHGQGEVRDIHNKFADPACGWSLRQKYPSLLRGDILVDDNTVQPDNFGRLPVFADAA